MLHAIERSIHFKHGLRDGISAIYANTVLRRLSLSLVGIFLPVYLFTKTQQYWVNDITHGFYGVILYYFFWVSTKTILLIPSANIIAKIGYRWSITLSNFLWMLLLVILFISDQNISFLFLAPFIHAVATCFYWLSYHSMFAEDGHLEHLGKEVGFAQLLGSVVSIIGPLTGGLIIDYISFSALFLTSLFVMALSGVPFFFLPKHKPKSPIFTKDVVSWFGEKGHLNEAVSIFGRGMEEKVTISWWPVYMFLIAGAYSRQGFVASLSMFIGAFAIYYSGKFMDKKGNKKRLFLGSVGTGILWPLRGLISNFSQLIFVDISMNLVSPFYWVNFESLVYKDVKVKGENNLLFMTVKLLITSFSYLVVLLVAFIFADTSYRFWGIITLASLGSILSYFIWESKK